MPRTIEGVRTWYSDFFTIGARTADVVLLSDGRIAVGFAGNDYFSGNGFLSVGILDRDTDSLVDRTTTFYAGTPAGPAAPIVDTLDLEAGPGKRLTATLFINESAIGTDTNHALLVQRFNGVVPTGTAVAVDPSASHLAMQRCSAIVYEASGGFRVFYADGPTYGDTNGIRMARFAADGRAIGGPVTVVADHPAGGSGPEDADPDYVDAVAMTNGNVALTWTERSASGAPTFGGPKVMLQVISTSGAPVGGSLVVDDSAMSSQVISLKDGGMVLAWLDLVPGTFGIWKAQMLTATGERTGAILEISSSISMHEADLSLVALGNGGWAASWTDVPNQAHLARMFDASGTATGGDFLIVDTAFDFVASSFGLVSKGSQLIAWISGEIIGIPPFSIHGQTYATSSTVGVTRNPGAGDDDVLGSGLDDLLSGGAGADTIRGASGGDTLEGGDGRDVLVGGNGMDQLAGGKGVDRLSGGAGPDSFVFRHWNERGDTIADFDGSAGDRLVLYSRGFGGSEDIASGESTDPAHQGLFFNTSTGVLSYDSDGLGTSARVTVVTLTGVASLGFGDAVFV